MIRDSKIKIRSNKFGRQKSEVWLVSEASTIKDEQKLELTTFKSKSNLLPYPSDDIERSPHYKDGGRYASRCKVMISPKEIELSPKSLLTVKSPELPTLTWSKRILIVDDEPFNQMGLKFLLSR